MARTDAVFSGSIPAFYDKYLGPLLFDPYAADLAARVANITEGSVLETERFGSGPINAKMQAHVITATI
jgi:hypothetical protein